MKQFLCIKQSALFKKSLIVLTFLNLAFGEFKMIDLENGDLIFVGAENSAFSEAISSATKKDEANFTHTAIVEKDQEGVFIIEASADKGGVVRTSLKEFLAYNKDRKMQVMRLKDRTKLDMNAIINRAKTYLGWGYDWNFLPNNSKIYCTELVWEAYLDKDGKRIFKANPMNFYGEDGKLPDFFKELFEEKLKVAVPQGVLGTNPNDLSKSKALYIVE